MKTVDKELLSGLTKAKINDPVIAGNACTTGNTGNASNAGSAGNRDEKAKITIRLSAVLLGQAREAYWVESVFGEARSFSDWVATQISNGVASASQKFNNGKPFTPRESLPPGRLTGR